MNTMSNAHKAIMINDDTAGPYSESEMNGLAMKQHYTSEFCSERYANYLIEETYYPSQTRYKKIDFLKTLHHRCYHGCEVDTSYLSGGFGTQYPLDRFKRFCKFARRIWELLRAIRMLQARPDLATEEISIKFFMTELKSRLAYYTIKRRDIDQIYNISTMLHLSYNLSGCRSHIQDIVGNVGFDHMKANPVLNDIIDPQLFLNYKYKYLDIQFWLGYDTDYDQMMSDFHQQNWDSQDQYDILIHQYEAILGAGYHFVGDSGYFTQENVNKFKKRKTKKAILQNTNFKYVRRSLYGPKKSHDKMTLLGHFLRNISNNMRLRMLKDEPNLRSINNNLFLDFGENPEFDRLDEIFDQEYIY